MNPVIGIIGISNDKNDRLYHISVVYVSWLRTYGCRVIYIHPMWEQRELDIVLKNIDGVIFPGSNNHPYPDEPVFKTFSRILEYAVETRTLPVYGICCGLHSIATYFGKMPWDTIKTYVNNEWAVSPTYFRHITNTSSPLPNVFKRLTQKAGEYKHNYNYNYAPSLQTFQQTKDLKKHFEILGTSFSNNKKYAHIEVVSCMIHKQAPIFASMFHPEKANYEWAPKQKNIDRSVPAVATGENIAAFFVELCRLYATERQHTSTLSKYDVAHLELIHIEPRGFDDSLVRVYLPHV